MNEFIMIIPKFHGRIAELNPVKIAILEANHYTKYIQRTFKKDEEILLSIHKNKKIRSTGKPDESGNQNGYYWAVVIPIIGEYCGYLPDEAHEALPTQRVRMVSRSFGS